jgi:hypothetical protein
MSCIRFRWALLVSVLAGCNGGGSASPPPPGGWKPPQILSFSPTAGPVGTSVVLQGILFAEKPEQNRVRFNGTTATVESASANEIVAAVPMGATTGPIEVTTPGGSTRTRQPFTVLVSSTVPGVSWTTRLMGPRSVEGLAWDGRKLVSVGDAIQTSSDVLRWEERMALTGLAAVAWNGQMFMAVGRSAFSYSSPTGLTWSRNPAAGAEISSLASSGPLWVAVGRSGAIRTSVEGTSWTTVSPPTTNDLTSVAWNGSQFVAVGRQGSIITSPDGATWTMRASGTSDDFTAVGATSSLLVATTSPSNNSPSTIVTSSDGVTWTARARDLAWGNAIIHAAGRWVVAGDYRVVTSTDGVSWALSANSVGILSSIVHTGDQFVAIGQTGSSVPASWTSPDGLAWQMRSSAQKFQAAARSGADGRLVAVALSNVSLASTDNGASWQSGGLETTAGDIFLDVEWFAGAQRFVALAVQGANERIHTSSDGVTWTAGAYAPYDRGLGASPTLLVNVGASLSGRGLATSMDGVTWTTRTVPSTQILQDAFWTGSQFIAVGNAGTIITSPDGASWTLRTSGTSAVLRGAAASPALTVVVGDSGTILTSRDGAAWELHPSGVQATLSQVVWTGGEFVAVGSAGRVLRSTDGTSWTVQPTPYTNALFGSEAFDLIGAVWTGSRLVAVGSRGLVATSP